MIFLVSNRIFNAPRGRPKDLPADQRQLVGVRAALIMYRLLQSITATERMLQCEERRKQRWARERSADSDMEILPGEKGSTDGSLGTVDTQNRDSFVAPGEHNQPHFSQDKRLLCSSEINQLKGSNW